METERGVSTLSCIFHTEVKLKLNEGGGREFVPHAIMILHEEGGHRQKWVQKRK